MKKLISILMVALLLSSCFIVPAFAQAVDEDGFPIPPVVEFSEDYTKVYFDGYIYSRIDDSSLDIYYVDLYREVVLTDTQKAAIKETYIQINKAYSVILASIKFNDGMTLVSAYIRTDYLNDFNRIISTDCEDYTIDFSYPANNTVKAKRADLFGEAEVFNKSKLGLCDNYVVKATVEEPELTVIKGFLLIYEREYYYVDCYETGMAPDGEYFDYHDFSELTVHKITNEELFAHIEIAEEEFYDDDYGYLYDDEFTDNTSIALIVFLFGIIPFVLLIVFAIKAIRSKAVYRKINIAVCVACVIELAVFIALVTYVSVNG